ncbi:hypothetical protein PG997_012136 [Apiospora hydei]|uniref:Uncharacterized protein n=1 Tax=Apiospora hydei TaxID=1337664 RepID=A0ABR1V5R4_9PEZI
MAVVVQHLPERSRREPLGTMTNRVLGQEPREGKHRLLERLLQWGLPQATDADDYEEELQEEEEEKDFRLVELFEYEGEKRQRLQKEYHLQENQWFRHCMARTFIIDLERIDQVLGQALGRGRSLPSTHTPFPMYRF